MHKKSLKYLHEPLCRLINILTSVGNAVFIVMMLALVLDVVLRRVFNSPLPWSMETTKILLVVVVSFTFSYCALKGGHIQIDILTNMFPQKVQKILDIAILLFSSVLYGFVTWSGLIFARDIWVGHRITGVLPIPIAPFVYILAFGFLLLTLLLLVRLTELIVSLSEEK